MTNEVERQKPTKDAIYWKVLNAAIALDIQRGHLKWTMTLLSKKSKVSRTLIYYYFGKSKIDLLKEAILTIGEELSGMSVDRLELWKQGKIAESFSASRQLIQENPALLYFYFYNRALSNELGNTIRNKEAIFKSKISRFFPNLDNVTYQSIYALFLGIVWADGISHEAVSRALEIVKTGLE